MDSAPSPTSETYGAEGVGDKDRGLGEIASPADRPLTSLKGATIENVPLEISAETGLIKTSESIRQSQRVAILGPVLAELSLTLTR